VSSKTPVMLTQAAIEQLEQSFRGIERQTAPALFEPSSRMMSARERIALGVARFALDAYRDIVELAGTGAQLAGTGAQLTALVAPVMREIVAEIEMAVDVVTSKGWSFEAISIQMFKFTPGRIALALEDANAADGGASAVQVHVFELELRKPTPPKWLIGIEARWLTRTGRHEDVPTPPAKDEPAGG